MEHSQRETEEDREFLVLRDSDLEALAYCPPIYRTAKWVFDIWHRLIMLAKLPKGAEGISNIKKGERLEWWVDSLFSNLADPYEIEGLESNGHPKEMFNYLEEEAPLQFGPIEGLSHSDCIVCMGTSVIHSIAHASSHPCLPPLTRIKPNALGFWRPKLRKEDHPRILEWVNSNLDPALIQGKHISLASEFRRGAKIFSGMSVEKGSQVHKRQAQIRLIRNEDGTLRVYAQYVLLAYYSLQDPSEADGPIQEAVWNEAALRMRQAGHKKPPCSRPHFSKYVPPLLWLKLIEGEARNQKHLTHTGRAWVERSGLLKEHKIPKK